MSTRPTDHPMRLSKRVLLSRSTSSEWEIGGSRGTLLTRRKSGRPTGNRRRPEKPQDRRMHAMKDSLFWLYFIKESVTEQPPGRRGCGKALLPVADASYRRSQTPRRARCGLVLFWIKSTWKCIPRESQRLGTRPLPLPLVDAPTLFVRTPDRDECVLLWIASTIEWWHTWECIPGVTKIEHESPLFHSMRVAHWLGSRPVQSDEGYLCSSESYRISTVDIHGSAFEESLGLRTSLHHFMHQWWCLFESRPAEP